MCDRDIIIETQSGQLQRINELNAAYLGLQYPLLFPYGEDGYREDIPLNEDGEPTVGRKCVSMREFFAYKIQDRKGEVPRIVSARGLFQQFLVDAYTMIESGRLKYYRTHQKQLRVAMYKGLEEVVLHGETTPSSQRKRIILPSSFTGGARYMLQNYQDAMAICKWAGYPDLFITFTCNPKWPEILRHVKSRGLNPEDRPDILSRVFKIKLDLLIKDLRDNKVFGAVKSVIYTIEFQKRGLPHAHMLLFLHEHNKYPTAGDIDQLITAEIPDETNGRCTKHFPKKFTESTTIDEDGYPIYRRRDNGRAIKKDGIDLDNRYVVPHNRFLLLKYGAHINVEWCNQSRSIKYLSKYVNKENDRATVAFSRSVQEEGSSVVDEINMYYNFRYISPCEAAWRILEFPLHYRQPSVERLSFYLPNEQHVIFSDDDPIDDVSSRPTLKRWEKRKTSAFSIGRIFFVPPGIGELYYLRLLLNVIKGPKCYEDLKRINNHDHHTFREACFALGLIDDDKEYVDCIKEASSWENVWQATWQLLAEDILHEERVLQANPEAELTDDKLKNRCLQKLKKILKSCGRSFHDFPTMPRPLYNEEEVDLAIGGRTAHSRFAIPLNPTEDSTCNIKQSSPLANLIIKTKLIIWDEAPMMHKYCFEALDQTLRDILRFKDTSSADKPFGGKTVVLGGDFRQILPVIAK
ncbi:PREDICTED: uncharacterized protein LOC109206711 [Nicotiana attenuata]|uniref:uncharacterized protein LOC109206711 n=1 Tax=Nicotiana attenuata TaxID=49451 RepID=UPI000904B8DD|nr:PREDICTED: uncharacterized protein LOC109206711 [Nicotiana attenuata]